MGGVRQHQTASEKIIKKNKKKIIIIIKINKKNVFRLEIE